MSLREKLNVLKAMSPQEREALIKEQENTPGTMRYKLKQCRAERKRQEEINRKHTTKLIIAALSSFTLSLFAFLTITFLYLN